MRTAFSITISALVLIQLWKTGSQYLTDVTKRTLRTENQILLPSNFVCFMCNQSHHSQLPNNHASWQTAFVKFIWPWFEMSENFMAELRTHIQFQMSEDGFDMCLCFGSMDQFCIPEAVLIWILNFNMVYRCTSIIFPHFKLAFTKYRRAVVVT